MGREYRKRINRGAEPGLKECHRSEALVAEKDIENIVDLMVCSDTQPDLKDVYRKVLERERKKAVRAMAITVNHEINQPLTVLKGYFEIFRRTIDEARLTGEQRQQLLKIKTSIDRIQSILDKYSDIRKVHFHFEKLMANLEMVVFES